MERIYKNKINFSVLLCKLLMSLDSEQRRKTKTKEILKDIDLLLEEMAPFEINDWISRDDRFDFFKNLPVIKKHLTKDYNLRGRWLEIEDINEFDWKLKEEE